MSIIKQHPGPGADSTTDNSEQMPSIASLILSALDSGAAPTAINRRRPRALYRTKGTLSLFSEMEQEQPRTLYTRDINELGVGFILEDYLPPSQSGILRLAGPDGQIWEIHCSVTRCRQVALDWYEGAVQFKTSQPQFDADHLIDPTDKRADLPKSL